MQGKAVGSDDVGTLGTNDVGVGVRGVSGSLFTTSGRGVHGNATSSLGDTFGVYGEAASNAGRGVWGRATDGCGPGARARAAPTPQSLIASRSVPVAQCELPGRDHAAGASPPIAPSPARTLRGPCSEPGETDASRILGEGSRRSACFLHVEDEVPSRGSAQREYRRAQ